jgi:excisionase family DNA binding protein
MSSENQPVLVGPLGALIMADRPVAKDSPAPARLYTVGQTAARMSCSPRTIWRLVGRNELRLVRLGRAARIDAESVEEFIARGGEP